VLEEALLDVEIARGLHVAARVAIPDNCRGVVATMTEDLDLAAACIARGFAVIGVDFPLVADEIDKCAAIFADVVEAVVADRAIFDRPVGFFGVGVGGVAALVGAALHWREVAAVVVRNAPLTLAGTHLSEVRAATLFLFDSDESMEAAQSALPPLPGGSMLIQRTDDAMTDALNWFEHTLRGVMRGARRELWRSA
jgi:pimeloyl-ACP methyl ester carboxylesterase